MMMMKFQFGLAKRKVDGDETHARLTVSLLALRHARRQRSISYILCTADVDATKLDSFIASTVRVRH